MQLSNWPFKSNANQSFNCIELKLNFRLKNRALIMGIYNNGFCCKSLRS